MSDSNSAESSSITQSSSAKTSAVIGPALPPEFLSKKKEENVSFGPSLPLELENSNLKSIGPALPPHMRKDSNAKFNLENDSTPIGSVVLPHASNESEENATEGNSKIIGPALPPHLRRQLQNQTEEICPEATADNEDETYGPMPAGMSKNSFAETALEERALQLRISQLGPDSAKEPVRESWMIDLPAAKAVDFGLGPRQFKNRPGPDMSDRSSWTDIPGEKGKPKNKQSEVDLKTEAELRELEKRDKEQELLTKKHKRKSKSLVEMHQEKIKKTSEVSSVNERRPFSRDIDLQVNRFDDAQKKAVLKKAQLLDDRFSAGKSKFL